VGVLLVALDSGRSPSALSHEYCERVLKKYINTEMGQSGRQVGADMDREQSFQVRWPVGSATGSGSCCEVNGGAESKGGDMFRDSKCIFRDKP